MTLESIEKYRERIVHLSATYPWLGEMTDEIEREVAERYMELPVDADGESIHVGDLMLKSTGAPKASYGEVVGVSDDSVWFSEKDGWSSNWSSLTRHYRKPTVEDVLDEFEHEIHMLKAEASDTRAKPEAVQEAYEKMRNCFADKLREAVKR